MATYELNGKAPDSKDHEYNSDQQGNIRTVPVADGIEIHVIFTNNKLVDGDHYRCDVYLKDATDACIAAAKIRVGVNARGIGGVNTTPIDEKIPLSPEQLQQVEKIIVDFGQFDEHDDESIWNQMGEAVLKYYFGNAVAPA